MIQQRPPFRILFVCMGNICRSPAAEIIFRKLAAETGRQTEFEIDSAGTIGYHEGAPPDRRMAATLSQRNYPVTGAARKIVAADLDRFDMILTMDDENFGNVRKLDPENLHTKKVRSFAAEGGLRPVTEIPDPYYGGQNGFDHVIDLLEEGCKGLLGSISFSSHPSP